MAAIEGEIEGNVFLGENKQIDNVRRWTGDDMNVARTNATTNFSHQQNSYSTETANWRSLLA